MADLLRFLPLVKLKIVCTQTCHDPLHWVRHTDRNQHEFHILLDDVEQRAANKLNGTAFADRFRRQISRGDMYIVKTGLGGSCCDEHSEHQENTTDNLQNHCLSLAGRHDSPPAEPAFDFD